MVFVCGQSSFYLTSLQTKPTHAAGSSGFVAILNPISVTVTKNAEYVLFSPSFDHASHRHVSGASGGQWVRLLERQVLNEAAMCLGQPGPQQS